MNEKLRNCICEFIGAFFITAFGCGIFLFAGVPDMSSAAIPVGMCVMAVTALFLPFSGAHFNPIVSLALFVKGKLEILEFLEYAASQLLGALAAFGCVALFEGGSEGLLGSEVSYLTPQAAFALETLCAFAFVFIYLEMTSRTRSAAVTPIIIGGAMAFILAWSLNVTGSVINPFRSLAAAMFCGGAYLSDLWIFLLAPFVGGALAGYLHPKICDE